MNATKTLAFVLVASSLCLNTGVLAISGGVNADKFDSNFAVWIEKGSNTDVHCGGTLMDREWVLTLLSCVEETLGLYRVHVGDTRMDSADTGESEHEIDYIVQWPGNLRSPDAVAMVKLATPVAYRRTIQPIALGGSLSSRDPRCYVSSFGYTSETSAALRKQKMQVYFVQNELCENNTNYEVDGGFCYTPLLADGLTAPCKGDAGSALVCGQGGVTLMYAINTEEGCDSDYNTARNVYELADWVDTILAEPPPSPSPSTSPSPSHSPSSSPSPTPPPSSSSFSPSSTPTTSTSPSPSSSSFSPSSTPTTATSPSPSSSSFSPSSTPTTSTSPSPSSSSFSPSSTPTTSTSPSPSSSSFSPSSTPTTSTSPPSSSSSFSPSSTPTTSTSPPLSSSSFSPSSTPTTSTLPSPSSSSFSPSSTPTTSTSPLPSHSSSPSPSPSSSSFSPSSASSTSTLPSPSSSPSPYPSPSPSSPLTSTSPLPSHSPSPSPSHSPSPSSSTFSTSSMPSSSPSPSPATTPSMINGMCPTNGLNGMDGTLGNTMYTYPDGNFLGDSKTSSMLCMANGYMLVTIESQAEYDFLMSCDTYGIFTYLGDSITAEGLVNDQTGFVVPLTDLPKGPCPGSWPMPGRPVLLYNNVFYSDGLTTKAPALCEYRAM